MWEDLYQTCHAARAGHTPSIRRLEGIQKQILDASTKGAPPEGIQLPRDGYASLGQQTSVGQCFDQCFSLLRTGFSQYLGAATSSPPNGGEATATLEFTLQFVALILRRTAAEGLELAFRVQPNQPHTEQLVENARTMSRSLRDSAISLLGDVNNLVDQLSVQAGAQPTPSTFFNMVLQSTALVAAYAHLHLSQGSNTPIFSADFVSFLRGGAGSPLLSLSLILALFEALKDRTGFAMGAIARATAFSQIREQSTSIAKLIDEVWAAPSPHSGTPRLLLAAAKCTEGLVTAVTFLLTIPPTAQYTLCPQLFESFPTLRWFQVALSVESLTPETSLLSGIVCRTLSSILMLTNQLSPAVAPCLLMSLQFASRLSALASGDTASGTTMSKEVMEHAMNFISAGFEHLSLSLWDPAIATQSEASAQCVATVNAFLTGLVDMIAQAPATLLPSMFQVISELTRALHDDSILSDGLMDLVDENGGGDEDGFVDADGDADDDIAGNLVDDDLEFVEMMKSMNRTRKAVRSAMFPLLCRLAEKLWQMSNQYWSDAVVAKVLRKEFCPSATPLERVDHFSPSTSRYRCFYDDSAHAYSTRFDDGGMSQSSLVLGYGLFVALRDVFATLRFEDWTGHHFVSGIVESAIQAAAASGSATLGAGDWMRLTAVCTPRWGPPLSESSEDGEPRDATDDALISPSCIAACIHLASRCIAATAGSTSTSQEAALLFVESLNVPLERKQFAGYWGHVLPAIEQGLLSLLQISEQLVPLTLTQTKLLFRLLHLRDALVVEVKEFYFDLNVEQGSEQKKKKKKKGKSTAIKRRSGGAAEADEEEEAAAATAPGGWGPLPPRPQPVPAQFLTRLKQLLIETAVRGPVLDGMLNPTPMVARSLYFILTECYCTVADLSEELASDNGSDSQSEDEVLILAACGQLNQQDPALPVRACLLTHFASLVEANLAVSVPLLQGLCGLVGPLATARSPLLFEVCRTIATGLRTCFTVAELEGDDEDNNASSGSGGSLSQIAAVAGGPFLSQVAPIAPQVVGRLSTEWMTWKPSSEVVQVLCAVLQVALSGTPRTLLGCRLDELDGAASPVDQARASATASSLVDELEYQRFWIVFHGAAAIFAGSNGTEVALKNLAETICVAMAQLLRLMRWGGQTSLYAVDRTAAAALHALAASVSTLPVPDDLAVSVNSYLGTNILPALLEMLSGRRSREKEQLRRWAGSHHAASGGETTDDDGGQGQDARDESGKSGLQLLFSGIASYVLAVRERERAQPHLQSTAPLSTPLVTLLIAKEFCPAWVSDRILNAESVEDILEAFNGER